ncbi:MAG TPA: Xaa-Pro peptidase family protein [Candidatus Dormibacteraeota bacterium]|nr:Xaa-Pro peptidase family protein [Candidatus Dormibacteraeota bacterium]
MIETKSAVIDRESSLTKARDAIGNAGLDALVAASPANFYYLTGTSFLSQRTIPERLGAVSVTRSGEPVLVYCTIEEGHARQESWISDIRGYTEFKDTPVDVLAGVLREQGVERGQIGIEMRFISARDYERLRHDLPEAKIVAADSLFDRMRAIKTLGEIELLGAAALATDESIRAAFERSSVGVTEREIGDIMQAECRSRGGEQLIHLVLATGENGFKVHAAPGNTKLERGGVLRTDFGMSWGGRYFSDIARTAFVGPLQPWQGNTYGKLEAGHQAVITAMRPGVKASELFRICAAEYERSGLDFKMPHIGHSIGVVMHENPMLQPYDDTPLEAGMVFMVEPGVSGRDGFYHTEDMILITEDGHRVLSRSADWSQPMVLA